MKNLDNMLGSLLGSKLRNWLRKITGICWKKWKDQYFLHPDDVVICQSSVHGKKIRFQSWKLGKIWIVNGSFTIANGSACGSSIWPQALVQPREWKTTCWAAEWKSCAKIKGPIATSAGGHDMMLSIRVLQKQRKIGSDVREAPLHLPRFLFGHCQKGGV